MAEDKPSEILSRQGHFKQNPNYVEIISEDVSSFRVAYTFRARDEEDVAILPELPEGERPSVENLPATLIEAWEQTSCGRGQSPIDPQGSVLDSCVKPENINDVYIQMKIKTPLPTHLWIDSVDSYEENFEEMNIRFQREEGQVIATINFQVSPKNYSTSRVAALASGDDLQCDPNKPENRCQPACSSAFTNPDRGASNWIGYGRYVGHPDGESSYCKCWTNPSDWNSNGLREVYEGDWSKIKIWDPRFIERSPDYARSIPENEQVEACGREYGNCSTWDPQHKHPGYRVACGCLQTDSANGSDHFSQRSPDRRPRFDSETASESGGFTLNQDQILRALAPLNALNRSLHCSSYRGCWDSLSRYLQGIGQGHLTSGLSDIFQERCQCLTRNIPFACDTAAIAAGASPSAECLSTTGSEIWNTHINWDLVCNLNHRHNSLRNPKTCPLTWTSTLTPTSEITVMQPFRVDLKSVLEQPVENSSFSANGYYNEYATGSYAKIFGLTRDAMNVCECIRGNLKGSYSANSYVPFDPSSERPYLSDGWNLDLRANGEPPPGILNPTEQRPHATYGSVEENKSPDFFALVGSDKQRLVQSEEGAVLCGALMCQKFKGPSCCTDRREESEGTGAGKVSNENLKPWSGYCNEECGLSSFGSAALAPMQQERDRIRRYITNTPSDQELPTTCGGSARTPDGGEGAL